jgi:Co/Zn/Cd efflux system component
MHSRSIAPWSHGHAFLGERLAWLFGWAFMDPLVGLVGTVVIASWAFGLVRSAGRVLLDTVPDPQLAQRIRQRMSPSK